MLYLVSQKNPSSLELIASYFIPSVVWFSSHVASTDSRDEKEALQSGIILMRRGFYLSNLNEKKLKSLSFDVSLCNRD